jgi:hypothetical protein
MSGSVAELKETRNPKKTPFQQNIPQSLPVEICHANPQFGLNGLKKD